MLLDVCAWVERDASEGAPQAPRLNAPAFVRAMGHLGLHLTETEAATMFAHADVTGHEDGVLELDEFIRETSGASTALLSRILASPYPVHLPD